VLLFRILEGAGLYARRETGYFQPILTYCFHQMKIPLLHTIAKSLKITNHLLKILALWMTMINYFLYILCKTQYSCTHYTSYTKFEGFGFWVVMGENSGFLLRCVIPVVCRKTNGEVNFSHETQLWWYVL